VPDGLIRTTDLGRRYQIMRDVMDKGLAVLEDPDAPRAERLRVTRDFYAFLAEKIPSLFEEFTDRYLRKE
jgi:hypothetical protein